MNKLIILLICSIGVLSCISDIKDQKGKPDDSKKVNEYLVSSVIYNQSAAEYKALCYQAFQIAKLRLEENLIDKRITAKRAVIVDVDETILNNSPFEAKSILENTEYPKYWDQWIERASAEPLPGALDFVTYAESKNVEVFYITNRKEKFKHATINNLRKFQFPFADETHVVCRTDESSKELRREMVEKKFNVALLIGDNLADFSNVFDKISVERRNSLTDSLKQEFGKRFIILPNSMYGDWLSSIYKYDNSLSDEQKDSIRKKMLKDF